MSSIFPSPITTGIGGPLAALFTGLTGYSKTLPWYLLCPIYCLIASPLILLLPIILPLYLLHVLSRHYRLTHTKKGAFDTVLNKEGTSATKESANIAANEAVALKATRKTNGAASSGAAVGSDDVLLSDEMKEAVNVAERTQRIEDEVQSDEDAAKRKHEYVATALSSYNTSAFIAAHMKLLSLSLLSYYTIFFAVFVTAGFAISNAMMIYVEKAKNSKQLQIATTEQLDYANAVNNILTISGIVIFLTLIVIFALIVVAAIKDSINNIANKSGEQGTVSTVDGADVSSISPLKTAFSVLFRNLPGFAVLMSILYAVFVVVERYYAHLRVIAIEAMVLGQSYFDPGMPFIALRLYIVYAFCVAFMFVILMSLNAVPLLHRSNKSAIASVR